jgi:hypothetical protein
LNTSSFTRLNGAIATRTLVRRHRHFHNAAARRVRIAGGDLDHRHRRHPLLLPHQ